MLKNQLISVRKVSSISGRNYVEHDDSGDVIQNIETFYTGHDIIINSVLVNSFILR